MQKTIFALLYKSLIGFLVLSICSTYSFIAVKIRNKCLKWNKKKESPRAETHFAYSQLPMIKPSELIIDDDQFGSVVDFLFLLFKH